MVWTWIDSKELIAFASEILEGVKDEDWTGEETNFQDCRPRLDFLNSKISLNSLACFLTALQCPRQKYTLGGGKITKFLVWISTLSNPIPFALLIPKT